VLRRLEHEGLARSRWESGRVAQREQRPPRRYYALTAAGEARLAEARARFPVLGQLAGWPRRA
jgi:DNA-binding PadR family transcriptional regulator